MQNIKNVRKCTKKTWNPTVINFKNFSEQKGFDWLAFGKDGTAYTACSLNRTWEKIQITSDSVGICENNFWRFLGKSLLNFFSKRQTELIKDKIYIFLISQTKLDESSFPSGKFVIKG